MSSIANTNTNTVIDEVSTVKRRLVQKISIEALVYRREDDLWDIEAELIDTKGSDFRLQSGIKKMGEAIHRMKIVMTINNAMNILKVNVHSLDNPYPGACSQIESAYQALIGLNLMKGFKKGVSERFNGLNGCSHITELCNVLPTAAIQAFGGELIDISNENPDQPMPFQLNRCHALRTDGETVKKYYPIWFGKSLEPAKISKIPG